MDLYQTLLNIFRCCRRSIWHGCKSIRVRTKACSRSSTNFESTKSYGMEPLDFLELPIEKKPMKSYEKTRVFQDTWACCFPWAEPVIGDDGLVFQV